jgi:DNA-binding CsgD family transcriptional regulator
MPGRGRSVRGELVRESAVRKMLQFVSGLASLEGLEEFRAGVLPGLRELVPCEIATYNEVDFEGGSMVAFDDPAGSMLDGSPEIFVRLGHQNPLIARYRRTRDGRPYKWSDLITRAQLHRLEIYRELYAPMGVEFQIATTLPSPPERIIGLALNRGSRDFSEADRRLLNLVRGPMIQAYRAVERYAELSGRLAALERGLEHRGSGVVILERRGRRLEAASVSNEARRLLGLDGTTSPGGPLPPAVERWLPEPAALGGDPLSVAPLVFDSPAGGRALVRLLPARGRHEVDALLIHQEAGLLDVSELRSAGLTARQAEVLRLVAMGRTNAQIAAELAISVRTVHKHLENVYERLGAATRTQAVLTAWSLARSGEAGEAVPAPG